MLLLLGYASESALYQQLLTDCCESALALEGRRGDCCQDRVTHWKADIDGAAETMYTWIESSALFYLELGRGMVSLDGIQILWAKSRLSTRVLT